MVASSTKKTSYPGFLDLADRLRDPVGLGKGIVNRVSQFLHEVFQWLFHRVLPYLVDAPDGASVPQLPVPIVVDEIQRHKRNYPHYRRVRGHSPGSSGPRPGG